MSCREPVPAVRSRYTGRGPGIGVSPVPSSSSMPRSGGIPCGAPLQHVDALEVMRRVREAELRNDARCRSVPSMSSSTLPAKCSTQHWQGVGGQPGRCQAEVLAACT